MLLRDNYIFTCPCCNITMQRYYLGSTFSKYKCINNCGFEIEHNINRIEKKHYIVTINRRKLNEQNFKSK